MSQYMLVTQILALLSVMRRLAECMIEADFRSEDWEWCFAGLQTCEDVLAGMLGKRK